MNEPLTFTVDRATWAVGGFTQLKISTDSKYSKVPDDTKNGKMCCLGFYIEQLADGTDNTLAGIDTPSEFCSELRYTNDTIPDAIRRLVRFDWNERNGQDYWIWHNNDKTLQLMNINDKDESEFDDMTREELLTKYFADIGVTVNFIGEFPQEEN